MAQSIDVVAPVPGLVASVAVAAGARVAAGDPVVILQAMKMEIVVASGAITAIGLYAGRREKSLNDYALGGRRVPWWAAMASIIAAETSAATFLGAPVEGYTNKSFAYVQLVLGLIIGRFIVGNVFLKPYYTFKVYTVDDY